MSTRRQFMQVSAAAAVGLCMAPRPAAAESLSFPGIIYTAENPGKWTSKVASHMPQAEVSGGSVMVKTPHPMSAEHFIVRHTLVGADGTVLGEMTFTPTDKPESTFALPAGYKGKCWATSFCNRHDFWVLAFDVA